MTNAFLIGNGLLGDMAAQNAGMMIGGIVVGILGGLMPLLVGLNKRRPVLAVLGFLVCLGGGMYAGLLVAGPVGLLSAVGLSNLPRRRRHRDY